MTPLPTSTVCARAVRQRYVKTVVAGEGIHRRAIRRAGAPARRGGLQRNQLVEKRQARWPDSFSACSAGH
jgi:hypothetical protein